MENDQVQQLRRTWLITTQCKVDDHWWESSESGHHIVNLFDVFQVKNNAESLFLEFKGRAWDLDSFVRSPPQSNTWTRKGLFTHVASGGNSVFYNGLMLDDHVSMKVLGKGIHYFSSYEDMTEAFDKLVSHYG